MTAVSCREMTTVPCLEMTASPPWRGEIQRPGNPGTFLILYSHADTGRIR